MWDRWRCGGRRWRDSRARGGGGDSEGVGRCNGRASSVPQEGVEGGEEWVERDVRKMGLNPLQLSRERNHLLDDRGRFV